VGTDNNESVIPMVQMDYGKWKKLSEIPVIELNTKDVDDDLNGMIEFAQKIAYENGFNSALNQVEKALYPQRILKSGNRTIVFWMDGTKTIVKRADDEQDSDYDAFTAALARKLIGTNSAVRKLVSRKTIVQEAKK